MTLTEEQRGTVGFGLEAARAALEEAIDRMSLAVRDEDGDVWEADPEQAEILQAILDRTEIAENHRCLELQYQLDSAESEIERLRANNEYLQTMIDEAHDLMNGTHLLLAAKANECDQQAAKIRDLEENCIYDPEDGKIFVPDGHPEIERLRTQIISKDARIKELEDAHKRAGAKYAKIIRELRSSVYANIPGLDVGKIGPDAETGNRDHVVGPDQMVPCWQITEERKAALSAMSSLRTDVDCPQCDAWLHFSDIAEHAPVLRAMLTEAA